jgi:hypothetical protein
MHIYLDPNMLVVGVVIFCGFIIIAGKVLLYLDRIRIEHIRKEAKLEAYENLSGNGPVILGGKRHD